MLQTGSQRRLRTVYARQTSYKSCEVFVHCAHVLNPAMLPTIQLLKYASTAFIKYMIDYSVYLSNMQCSYQ